MKTCIWMGIVIVGWVTCGSVFAADATWTGAQNNNYQNSNNWSPVTIPNTGANTATFGTSAVTAVSVSGVTVGTFSFTAPAPAYTFTVGSLDFAGSGIVNSSANTQTLNVNTTMLFDNSSSAGTNVAINVASTGQLGFKATSTAGSAVIVNNGGGTTQFAAGSTAGSANITANAGSSIIFNTTGTGGAGNSTLTATGANAKIIFNGALAQSSVINTSAGGTVNFNGASDAGTSSITVSAAGAASFNGTSTANGATFLVTGANANLFFNNSSTAASSTITNSSGGLTTFNNTSTAGSATININSGSATVFSGGATAATATLKNNAGGTISFNNGTTAASSSITNSGASSVTNLNNTSTAGSSTIVNSSGGMTNFNNTATAGSANITNNAGSATVFTGGSTAATATLINNGGGDIGFDTNSTAANATITNATGGAINFNNSSTAANAVIGNSGTLAFNQTADGGSAVVTSTGGTLNIALSAGIGLGTLNGNGSVILGVQNLTLGVGDLSSNYSGIISDSGGGSFTKTGTGTVTLSGANTYSGGTTVKAGTLQVGNASALGAATGALTINGGTLDLNGFSITVGALSGTAGVITSNVGGPVSLTAGDGTTQTYAGTIQDGSGIVSFTKQGTGTLTLSGANSYSGGTTVNAGTLQVENASALGASSGALTIHGGTLDLNGFNVTAGAFSGTSGVVTSNVAGPASLTAGDATTQTYAGIIQDGSGIVSFTKQGSGVTTFTGANSYSGGTTVSAGTLQVGNASALGTGNVVVNGGTLSTNGIQTTINVTGNYTETGGTLSLTLLGPTTNNNEQLTVTGTAGVGGGLAVNGNNVPVTANLSYDLVHANGGVSGTFGSTTLTNFTMSAGLFPVFNYTANDVTLTFRQSILSVAGLTPNQQAVGTYIDTFAPIVTTGNFGTLVNNIYLLSGDPNGLGAALDQISPQSLQVFYNIAIDNAGFTVSQVDDHLADLRDGLSGFDDRHLNFTDATLPSELSQIKGRLLAWDPSATPGLVSDAVDPVLLGLDKKGRKIVLSREPIKRWSTFISGNVVLADLSHNQDLAHQSYTTGSVAVGADYRIDNHFTVGTLFGYGHTDAALDHIGSTASVDSYSPGIYASYVDGGWYGNGLFSYGYNSYDENRNIQIGTLNGTNHGTPSGSQFVSSFTGGYEFKHDAWKYGPVASVQYVNLGIDSFTEQGPTALNIQSQSVESFRSRLGFEARYKTLVHSAYGSFLLTPHLSATWQHEYLDDSQGITSQFNQIGAGSFTVQTSNPDRDSALLDFGLDAQLSKEVLFFVDYSTQVGQDNYFAQSIGAGLKIQF